LIERSIVRVDHKDNDNSVVMNVIVLMTSRNESLSRLTTRWIEAI